MKNAIDFEYDLEKYDDDVFYQLKKSQQAFLIDLFKKNILFNNGDMSATMFARYIKKSCQLGIDIDLIPASVMIKTKMETGLEYAENHNPIEAY